METMLLLDGALLMLNSQLYLPDSTVWVVHHPAVSRWGKLTADQHAATQQANFLLSLSFSLLPSLKLKKGGSCLLDLSWLLLFLYSSFLAEQSRL